MPIGKDSITKRVAKVEPQKAETPNIAPELVATTAAAPKKAPAKKTTSTAKPASSTKTASTEAKKTTAAKKTTTAKKAPAKKDTATEKLASPAEVATNVLSNVAPETVEAVIGHKEDTKYEKVSIGDDMPSFLL